MKNTSVGLETLLNVLDGNLFLLPFCIMNEELSYGCKAVGLDFNPSGDSDVTEVKKAYATVIDRLHQLRDEAGHSEKGRLLSVAITEAQTAQMWAVKGITWKD